MATTSVTLGVSLASRKRLVSARAAATTAIVAVASAPICSPPLMLGQETFSS